MKKIVYILVMLILLYEPVILFAQQDSQVTDQVNKAMKEANSKDLAALFHSTVDLEVGDTDGNYSNKQAEMIIREFFTNNPIKSYTVKHEGSSDDGSKYIIGSFVSKSNNEYRVYILLKRSDAGLRINQLQLEAD